MAEVVTQLDTDAEHGLSPDEAAARLARHGTNELPASTGNGPLVRLLRQFRHPLIAVLLVASAVTLALGELVDSAVILSVVLITRRSATCRSPRQSPRWRRSAP